METCWFQQCIIIMSNFGNDRNQTESWKWQCHSTWGELIIIILLRWKICLLMTVEETSNWHSIIKISKGVIKFMSGTGWNWTTEISLVDRSAMCTNLLESMTYYRKLTLVWEEMLILHHLLLPRWFRQGRKSRLSLKITSPNPRLCFE